MAVTDLLLDVEEMAKVLKVKPYTIRAWVKEGHIPERTYIHVGNTYRFDRRAVVNALKNLSKGNDPNSHGSGPVQLELGLEEDDEF